MAGSYLVAEGLRETVRAFSRAERAEKVAFRTALGGVGELVRDDWADRLRPYDDRAPGGLRVRVRQTGISVEQTNRKVTGLRPDFGALQMRRGLAALASREDDAERALERALDTVVHVFDR